MANKNILITKKRVSYNPFKMILPYLFGILVASLPFILGLSQDEFLGPLFAQPQMMYPLIIILFVIGFVIGWIINSIWRAIRN